MSTEERQKQTIKALFLQYVYLGVHDDVMVDNGITQRTKRKSVALVEQYEYEAKKMMNELFTIGGNDGVSGTLKVIESIADKLAALPLEYWADVEANLDAIISELPLP